MIRKYVLFPSLSLVFVFVFMRESNYFAFSLVTVACLTIIGWVISKVKDHKRRNGSKNLIIRRRKRRDAGPSKLELLSELVERREKGE